MKQGKLVKSLLIIVICLITLFVIDHYGYFMKQENYVVETREYSNTDENNQILIGYPQFLEFDDTEKEKRINDMIEKDAKKMMLGNELYEEGNLVLKLENDIKFLNTSIISILYHGIEGVNVNHSRYPSSTVMATTLDIKNEKILTLSDIIIDFNGLKKLLIEDQFESLTKWEGIQFKFSQIFGTEISFLRYFDEWNDGEYKDSSKNMEWYTDGKNFIVIMKDYRYYYEYSIDMDSIKSILSKEFLDLLK